jgi:hypothetical protein
LSVKQNCKVVDHFDVVAQSGCGGDVGHPANNYDLAKEIALFPIPVIPWVLSCHKMKRFAK